MTYLPAAYFDEAVYYLLFQLLQFYNDNKYNLGELKGTVNNTLWDVKNRIDWVNKYSGVIEQSLHGHLSRGRSPPTVKILIKRTQASINNIHTPSSADIKKFCSYLLLSLIVFIKVF